MNDLSRTSAAPLPTGSAHATPALPPSNLRPPMWMLGVALAAVVVAAGLLTMTGKAVNLVGYVLAMVITMVLVVAFRSTDSSRRGNPTYTLPPTAQWVPPAKLSMIVLSAGILVGLIHLWRLADAIGRT